MPGKIHAFTSGATRPMMDDEQTVIHANPLNADGSPFVGALPGGGVPSYDAQGDPSLTLDASQDATGMTCIAKGVKGQAGAPTVLISFTNPDGTVATGSQPFVMTVDVPAVDVNDFVPTTDTPTKQAAAAARK